MWPDAALASFSVVSPLREEQNVVLQNTPWSEGQVGKRRGLQTLFPLFPKQESSDFKLFFFRKLLPDITHSPYPHSPFLTCSHESKNKSILENPKAQLEHANMNSEVLGISVVLLPVLSKNLLPTSVNFILIALLWGGRTCCTCSITPQMVQSDLTQSKISWTSFQKLHLLWETFKGGSSIQLGYPLWMISSWEDKTVLVFCSAQQTQWFCSTVVVSL